MGWVQLAFSKSFRLARGIYSRFGALSFKRSRLAHLLGIDASLVELSPMGVQKRLYRQVGVFASAVFLISSLSATGVGAENYADAYSDYVGAVIIADTDGYLTKLAPQTIEGDRSGMSDSLTHIVSNGETLSSIAAKYSIKVDTIMWQNGISNPNALRIGQELVIPPADGVYHKVKDGDTLSKIAGDYKIDSNLIAKQNSLEEGAVLSVGQELFIPGAQGVIPVEQPAAKPANAPANRNTIARTGTSSRATYVANPGLANSTETPAAGKTMIWPTSGKVTQGYKKYHPALDIAKYPGGPIWAACSGTIAKASAGTYAGGYGNHVIIDCGNGIKTLYAHMEYLSVSAGDAVSQGTVLGKMGNTGRVYGRTGVHLHFEVWKNGVKQSPWNYLQ